MALFRIRDILIQIRILGVGSVHWITDPDPYPDTALFGSGFQDKKIVLLPSFFAYFLLHADVTSVFEDNMSFGSHKTVENVVYLISLHIDGRIRIWIRTNYYGSGS
jgi:hypothetical protein